MATQREVLVQMVQQARENKDFFHSLVFDPEKALASFEGLDETTRKKLQAISPNDFLVAPLVQAIGVGLSPCDPTCDESCAQTCGALSCDVTCGTDNHSCGKTCGASCGTTLTVAGGFRG
jgi:hypothetical protein